MLENLLGYLNTNYLMIVLSGSALVTFLFLSSISKSYKFPILEAIMLIITYLVAAFKPIAVYFFGVKPTFTNTEFPFNIVLCLAIVGLLLIMHIIYIFRIRSFSRGTRLFQIVPSNIESSIYAYYDKKSNLLMFTNHFYNKVKIPREDRRAWFKQAEKIVCDMKVMTYKEFTKYLKDFEEKDIELNIVFEDYRVIDLSLQKVKVLEDEKLVGYILVDKKQTAYQLYTEGTKGEFKMQLHMFFDSLNEAVAYYDNDLDKYRLTEPMTIKLGVTEQVLGIEEIKGFINEFDLPVFDKMLRQLEGCNTYRYRLKTINGLEWQEEVRTIEGGVVYSVLRKAEFKYNKVEYKSKNDLLENLKTLIASKNDFGVVFLSLKKVNNIIEKMGKEFSNMLVDKYFNLIEESTLKGTANIYKISDIEFCICIENYIDYEQLIRNISNEVSDLLKADLYVSGTKYRMNNALGLVSSKNITEPTPELYIKAGLSCLAMAVDANYEKDFSIYFPRKEGDPEAKFEEYKVDIDNKFLDEI